MKPVFPPFLAPAFLGLLIFQISICHAIAGSKVTTEPIFTFEETYTDNLFLDDENAEEELITTVGAGVRAAAENPTSGLRVEYRLGFSRYSRFSENNDVRHEASAESWKEITRHDRISLTNSFRITEEPTEDFLEIDRDPDEAPEMEPVEIEAETVRRTRNRYLENSFDLNYSRQFGPADTLNLQYRHDLLRNEDPTIRNRELHRPSVNLAFWPLPNTLQVLAESAYSREDVESAVDDPGFFEEELDSRVSLTYWILPRQFSLRGGIEYVRGVFWDDAFLLEAESGRRREDNWYESLIPSIGFYYRWIPRKMEFEGEVSRERAVTYGEDGLSDAEDDFETWSGRVAITYFLSRRLDLLAGYTFAETDFFRDGGRNEDFLVHGPSAGFRYRLGDDLPVQLTLGFLERDRAVGGRETAITVNGTLGQWEFYRNATLRFDVSSGYTDSNLGAEPLGFGFFYDAQLILGYRFHRDWLAEFRGYYRKNRFVDFEENEDPRGEVRDDRIQEYRTVLSYQMRRWLSFQLSHAYRDVNATETEDSYTENRVMFQVGVTTPNPFRAY